MELSVYSKISFSMADAGLRVADVSLKNLV